MTSAYDLAKKRSVEHRLLWRAKVTPPAFEPWPRSLSLLQPSNPGQGLSSSRRTQAKVSPPAFEPSSVTACCSKPSVGSARRQLALEYKDARAMLPLLPVVMKLVRSGAAWLEQNGCLDCLFPSLRASGFFECPRKGPNPGRVSLHAREGPGPGRPCM